LARPERRRYPQTRFRKDCPRLTGAVLATLFTSNSRGFLLKLPENRVKEAVIFIKNCMETQPFHAFSVPIMAESAAGQRFGELTELEGFSEKFFTYGAEHFSRRILGVRFFEPAEAVCIRIFSDFKD